jgi:hypothetical protein
MISNDKQWKNLFLFGLGLALGAAFCMKWMEKDLWVNGEKFTIMQLELFYREGKLTQVLTDLSDHVRVILRYHLSFDFAFMAGIYPAIAALCMLAREKLGSAGWKIILTVFAALQTAAWGLDMTENYILFKWIEQPAIDKPMAVYHAVVIAKWLIALIGVLLSLPVIVFKKNPGYRRK